MNNAELGWTVTQVPTDYTPLIIIILISVCIVILKEFIQWRMRIKRTLERQLKKKRRKVRNE